MSSQITNFFNQIQEDYHRKNKVPEKIFYLLQERVGQEIVNDHIALRTFNHPRIGIQKLIEPFLQLGYEKKQTYVFEEKKLKAVHLEHQEKLAPKVFVSELEIEKLSEESQEIIKKLTDQITEVTNPLCLAGRLWEISWEDYCQLAKESEYAAWMSAHGFTANHFTISINHLPELTDIVLLNQFLKENGYPLNDSGGEIKGSEKDYLEQSSTVAELVEVSFRGELKMVPGCFVEFAKRYEDASGQLFQGFVPTSADKIFESTDLGLVGSQKLA